MIVSRPAVGKHIKFDGRLLHAAPSDLLEEIDDEEEEEEEEESESEEEEEEEEEEVEEEEDSKSAYSSHDEKEIVRKVESDLKVLRPENIRESESDSDESSADSDSDYPKRVTFLVNVWLNHVPTQSEGFPESRLKNMKSNLSSPTRFDATAHESSTHVGLSWSPCRSSLSAPAFDSRVRLTHSEHLDVPTISTNSKCNLPSDTSQDSEQVEFSESKAWKFTNGKKKYVVTIPLPPAKQLNFLLDKYNAFRISYGSNDLVAKIDTVSSKKRKTNSVPVMTVEKQAGASKNK